MGFRFRKSIKIFPGLRLNVGARGVSATVGVRGASVNVGSKGAFGNVGIPGTGISYRTRLSVPETTGEALHAPPDEIQNIPSSIEASRAERSGSRLWIWIGLGLLVLIVLALR